MCVCLIQVKLSVIYAYIKACTLSLSFLTLIFFIVSNGLSVASNFWLNVWSNSNVNTTGDASKGLSDWNDYGDAFGNSTPKQGKSL